MSHLSIKNLKKSDSFRKNIRWDVTPKIFLNPRTPSGETIDITYGYMLYVDLINNKPAMFIMQLKRMVSSTVGYVTDIPEDLLREAMHCTKTECISGMYPLGEKLESWLKEELGLN